MTATVHRLDTSSPDYFPDGTIGSAELCARAGLSYRRCDYWTRTGRLHTATGSHGSGYRIAYPTTEVPVAALMRRFSDVGVDLDNAERLARELATSGISVLAGITLHLPQEP